MQTSVASLKTTTSFSWADVEMFQTETRPGLQLQLDFIRWDDPSFVPQVRCGLAGPSSLTRHSQLVCVVLYRYTRAPNQNPSTPDTERLCGFDFSQIGSWPRGSNRRRWTLSWTVMWCQVTPQHFSFCSVLQRFETLSHFWVVKRIWFLWLGRTWRNLKEAICLFSQSEQWGLSPLFVDDDQL